MTDRIRLRLKNDDAKKMAGHLGANLYERNWDERWCDRGGWRKYGLPTLEFGTTYLEGTVAELREFIELAKMRPEWLVDNAMTAGGEYGWEEEIMLNFGWETVASTGFLEVDFNSNASAMLKRTLDTAKDGWRGRAHRAERALEKKLDEIAAKVPGERSYADLKRWVLDGAVPTLRDDVIGPEAAILREALDHDVNGVMCWGDKNYYDWLPGWRLAVEGGEDVDWRPKALKRAVDYLNPDAELRFDTGAPAPWGSV